jgi:hypothetical protein
LARATTFFLTLDEALKLGLKLGGVLLFGFVPALKLIVLERLGAAISACRSKGLPSVSMHSKHVI